MSFDARAEAAAKARQAALERFRAVAEAKSPGDEKEEAERALARSQRDARRAAAEEHRKARVRAEKAARRVLSSAESASAPAAETPVAATPRPRTPEEEAALKAEQKAARDRRYAARKARNQ